MLADILLLLLILLHLCSMVKKVDPAICFELSSRAVAILNVGDGYVKNGSAYELGVGAAMDAQDPTGALELIHVTLKPYIEHGKFTPYLFRFFLSEVILYLHLDQFQKAVDALTSREEYVARRVHRCVKAAILIGACVAWYTSFDQDSKLFQCDVDRLDALCFFLGAVLRDVCSTPNFVGSGEHQSCRAILEAIVAGDAEALAVASKRPTVVHLINGIAKAAVALRIDNVHVPEGASLDGDAKDEAEAAAADDAEHEEDDDDDLL